MGIECMFIVEGKDDKGLYRVEKGVDSIVSYINTNPDLPYMNDHYTMQDLVLRAVGFDAFVSCNDERYPRASVVQIKEEHVEEMKRLASVLKVRNEELGYWEDYDYLNTILAVEALSSVERENVIKGDVWYFCSRVNESPDKDLDELFL